MNPYLSNTMPELTEQERQERGHDSVAYYNPAVNSYVACKASIELALNLVGLEGGEREEAKKEWYRLGKIVIATDKPCKEVTWICLGYQE